MHFIDSLNETRFTLNGAEYLRNYVSAVRAGKVEIFNCYETKDVLVPLSQPGEISVNGSVYDNAMQLQSALQDVIFSRSNLGGSMEGQNNKGRMVSLGRIADTSLEYIAGRANQFRITILETECPVLFTGIRPNGRSSMKYYYLFLGGKGSWGLGGSDVLASHLVMLTSERVTPLLLLSEDNILIHNLGSVRETEFLRTVNSSVWDFRETVTANYFSYGESVSAYKIFSGKPGIYGGDETEFTEKDFELVTDDTVTSSASTPNLAEVLSSGGVAKVTGPFSVTVGSDYEGGNLILDGGEFRAGNSNGFMFSTGGDFRISNGGNISLDCSKIVKLNGGQGFSFEGGSGGSIIAESDKGITISGRAGGINLLGNALGVMIDGQGGKVVINSPNGIELISGMPIQISKPLLLSTSEGAPLVFGQDTQKDPGLIRDGNGTSLRVINGDFRVGGSSFDTMTHIASSLNVGDLTTTRELRSQILTGTGVSGIRSDSNSISIDSGNHDMHINADGDINVGSSGRNTNLTVFRDVNIYGKGGYWFGIQASGPVFNAKEVLVNGLQLANSLSVSSSAGVTLSGTQGLLLSGGKNGIVLQDAPASYKEDYSSKFTERSIVDKAYVDQRTSKLVSVTGDIVDNTDPRNPVVRVPTLTEVLWQDNSTEDVIKIKNIQLHDPSENDYKVIRIDAGKCYMQRTVKGRIAENSFEFSGEQQNFVFPDVGGELATKNWVNDHTTNYTMASPTQSGVTKLYNQLGNQADGAVDQATVTNQLSLKANLVAPVFTGPVTIASGGLTITGGGTSTYMRGDGSAASFVNGVRAATVSGGTSSVALIASGNTIDNAIWQIQNQVKASSAFAIKTASYTAVAADNTLACNGTFTLTLPSTGIVAGKRYLIKNTGTGKITIIVSSGGTIDGAPSFEILTQWSGAEFTFDGTNYLITSVF